MKVTLTRKGRRHQLTCHREDGSVTRADLGPTLPHHDLAHFVVETVLGLTHGFFGNVRDGYGIGALSEKDVIASLGAESWQAEVAARALGSLATGACVPEQFNDLVNVELEHLGLPRLEGLSAELARDMLSCFRDLVDAYVGLEDGRSLVLEFPSGQVVDVRGRAVT